MEWLISIPDRLVSVFVWLIEQLQGLVPLALGAGELITFLLVICAPAFIAYGISRWVSRAMLKSMGPTDALITVGIFAIAAAGGLGSLLGIAASIGGIAVVAVLIWMFLTAAGFLFGSRPVLGTVNAIVISGLILPLSIVLGLTVYAL